MPVLVSVLMPVYNTALYLEEAIESILTQSFTNFEFIIIDDGSTDRSLTIIEQYAQKDKRIKVISRNNQGLIKTLNQGLALAKGKYIARMDSDDVSLSLRFEKQVKYLEKHLECVAVGSMSQLIDSDGDVIGRVGELLDHNDIDDAHIKGQGGAIIHPSAMIRKETMLHVGGYSDYYLHAEDLDFWLRLAEVGKLYNISEELFLYRQHLESVGYTQRASQFKSAKKAVIDAYSRRGMKFNSSKLQAPNVLEPTVCDVFIKWGWWALRINNIRTARKYARKAIVSNFFKIEAWKLWFCSMRGF